MKTNTTDRKKKKIKEKQKSNFWSRGSENTRIIQNRNAVQVFTESSLLRANNIIHDISVVRFYDIEERQLI